MPNSHSAVPSGRAAFDSPASAIQAELSDLVQEQSNTYDLLGELKERLSAVLPHPAPPAAAGGSVQSAASCGVSPLHGDLISRTAVARGHNEMIEQMLHGLSL